MLQHLAETCLDMTFPYTPVQHLVLWSATRLSPPLSLTAAGWLAQRQINTSVHESCSPHTPKTIAGGLCAGRSGLLSSQSAHTACFLSATELEMFFRAGLTTKKKKKKLCSLCAPSLGLIVRQSSMSLHENGKQNSLSQ